MIRVAPMRKGFSFPAVMTSFLNTVTVGVILLVALAAGLFPAATKFNLYHAPVIITVLAVVLCGLLLRLIESRIRPNTLRRYRTIVIAAFIASFAVLSIVAFALESTGYTWDSQTVFNQAVAYATHGSIDGGLVDYFVASPNNIGLLALLGGLFRLSKAVGFTNYLDIATGLNVIVLASAQILTFKCARMLYGRRIALISLFFTFTFITLSLYVQTPYTDTLTILFPILLLYLALHVVKAKKTGTRVVLALVIGVATLIGYELKPTVVIAFIALTIAGVFALIRRAKTAGILHTTCYGATLVAAIITGATGAYIGLSASIDTLHVVPYPYSEANQNSLPLVHFIDIGMKTKRAGGMTYYGGYDDASAKAVAALPNKSEKIDYSVDHVQSQLHSYGPIGYVRFLLLKLNWITSDGTFYAYGEGSNANVVFANHTMLSQAIRQVLAYNGAVYGYFANFLQVVWIALLLLIGAQVVILATNAPSRRNLYIMSGRLMLIGIMAFLLIFEGRSRYLYLYLPIFIIVGLYTLFWYRQATAASNRRAA